MGCVRYQIDESLLNIPTCVEGVSYPSLMDGGLTVGFAWSEYDGSSFGVPHNKQIYFRTFNLVTETFGTRHLVVDANTAPEMALDIEADIVQQAYIPATDEINVLYANVTGTFERHSTDRGVSWSAYAAVSPVNSFYQLIALGQSPTGALYAWCQFTTGGAHQRETLLYKRPAGSHTWGRIGPSPFATGSAVNGISETARSVAPEISVFNEDGQTALAVMHTITSPNSSLRCYFTSNDWATVSTVDIKTFVGATTSFHPIVKRGIANPNRIYCFWIELDPAPTPWLAYTDNWGAAWTTVGSLTDIISYGWDEAYDRAFLLDNADRLYAAVFTTGDGTAPDHDYHRWFKNNNPSQTGWTSTACDMGDVLVTGTENSSTCGNLLYAVMPGGDHTKMFRVFHRNDPTNGQTHYEMLIVTDFVPPPGHPPICIVTPLSDYIVLPDGSVKLCGPDAPPPHVYTYAWTGPGGFTASTKCITVTTPGTYNLTVTDENGLQSSCSGLAVAVPAQPVGSLLPPLPFMRGYLPSEPSGHPSGTPTVQRVGW